MSRVDAELQAEQDEAEARIGELRQKALGELDTIAATTAVAVAQHLAGLDVTDDEARKVLAGAKE